MTDLQSLDDHALAARLLELGVAGRRETLAALEPGALAAILGRLSPRTLNALSRQGIAALGSYRTRLVKRERVQGTLVGPQTLELSVRPAPFAFRIEFVRGPSSGRRVLYNEELKPREVRVKEAGMLGIAGALWLDLDNPLTRRDTNHRATEIGLAALLDLIEADLRRVEPYGGHTRTDEGFGSTGLHFTSEYVAPSSAKGLYAERTKLTFDPVASLPVTIEVHDRAGLLERYEYRAIESASFPTDHFTLKAAKL